MKTVVILHGWGHNKEMWQPVIEKFQDANVIAFDLPGFGEEPLISPDWGVPEYANWVSKKIETLDIYDVILLGHSFGGRIASFIASQNPKWLKGLILYAAPSIYRPTNKTRFKIRINKLLKYVGVRKKTKNPELLKADELGLGKIFRKVVPFDQTELLKKINTPTLIVWGQTGTESPVRIGKEINALISSSKLVILENLGHNAYLENPNLFYGTIKGFIENL